MKRELKCSPSSWGTLSWQQLCAMWDVKQRYGGNADIARVAALLELLGCRVSRHCFVQPGTRSVEPVYLLTDADKQQWTVTPRELAWMAKKAIPWFDFPYGDRGDDAVKDQKSGKILKERREPVFGYVGPMRDAMALPLETVVIGRRHFALPQVACSNLSWHQYRSLQGLTPQLFSEGITDSQALQLQAQFLAYILVPRSVALLDTSGTSVRLRPHFEYVYNAEQAEELSRWMAKRMDSQHLSTIFHICFQVYQTALAYYSAAYPLLFQDDGKVDKMRDALQGEVGTINTIMKYAGYTDQNQVYESKLPFIMGILNTMTKEAKEIERMNAKIKKK